MLEPTWTRAESLAAGVISAADPGMYDFNRENEVFRHCRIGRAVAWRWIDPAAPEDIIWVSKPGHDTSHRFPPIGRGNNGS